MPAREDLLFGMLAVQTGLLDAVAFLDAWASLDEGGPPLPDLLVQRGLILPEDREHLAYLARRRMPGADAAPRTAVTVMGGRAGDGGRYHYLDRCGTGGMGDVWRARDTRLGRDVAIKELKPSLADDEVIRARFLREARITSQLDHPGIVPLYDLLPDEGGRPRYAMRLLRGRTLSEAIRAMHGRRQAGEDVSLERAGLLQAFVTVCNTVAYAHSRGVLHRDLKPANIQLGDFGEVVVLDWGLAGSVRGGDTPTEDADARVTLPGHVFGTPEYMAPEQASGDIGRIDQRSDIYGLGAILYQMLTGSPPFRGASMSETLALVREGEPTPVRELCPDVPAGLEAICHKALSKRPEDRHADAASLGAAVLQWQESERLAAEEALQKSEERLRLALDAGRCGVWDWDILADHITWSERVYEFHGVKPGEFSGRVADYAALLHPDDAAALRDAIRRAVELGEPYAQERRAVRPDGEVRWFSTQGRVIRDGDGRAVRMLGAIIDVTERRAAEEALRESEERFRTLIEAIPQIVWIRRPDWYVEYINHRSMGTADSRWKREQFLGMRWQEIFHPEDLERNAERVRQAQETGKPYESEFRLKLPDGTYRWFLTRAVPMRDPEGRVSRWFGTSTDIQDLKQAMQERDAALEQARASEVHFRTLVEAVPQIVWIRRPDWHVEYINHRTMGAGDTRWWSGQFLGLRWQELFHPEDTERSVERVRVAQESGKPYESEFRLRLPDGSYRWFLTRAVPMRDAEGRIEKWFGTTTDIHDLKQAVQERDEALALVRLSEQRHRLLTEMIPHSVWTTTPEGVPDYVNRHARDLQGLGLEEMGRDTYHQVVHPDDLPGFKDRWELSLATGEPFEKECRVRDAAGEYRWYLSRAVAIRDDQGRITQWFGTNTDIDTLKRAEMGRSEANERPRAS